MFYTSLDATTTLGATIIGTNGQITIDPPFWFPSSYTIRVNGQPPEQVEIPNQGLAHEAAHAMERIRGGHLESDVIPLDVSDLDDGDPRRDPPPGRRRLSRRVKVVHRCRGV